MTHTLEALRAFLQSDGATILPELELLLFIAGILAMDRWLDATEKRWNAWLALCGLVFSAFTLWSLRAQVAIRGGLFGFHDSLLVDPYFLFFAAILLAAVALVMVLSAESPGIPREKFARYFSHILLATAAMLVMISATNLLPLFLGIEAMSCAASFLGTTQTVSNAESPARRHSLGKMLIPHIGGTICTFTGCALLYRLTASLNIGEIGQALGQRSELARAIALANEPGTRGEGMRQLLQSRMPSALQHHLFPLQTLPLCALVLIAVGLFLKVMAACWYSSSRAPSAWPSPPAAFSAIAAATGSFALFLRLLLTVFASSQDNWLYIAEISALLMLAIASIAAIFQTSVSKLLFAAAMTQFAFIFLGLVSANETGIYGITFYLICYVFTLAGAYLALGLLSQNEGVIEKIADLRGLYHRNPATAILLGVFLLSLAGIPVTAGFLAKYSMLKSLIESHHATLAIIAIILFVPTLWACLRTAYELFQPVPAQQPRLILSNSQAIALGICLFVTLAAGLYPEPFRRLAHYAFGQ